MEILKCENLSKNFKQGRETIRVLKSVNMEFHKGSINVIMGESGSGKTTFLNLLAGIEQPTDGSVYYQGGVLYSREEILMDERIFTTYNRILSFILITINILFGSIMVIVVVYRTIKKNMRTYGVLRMLGMSFERNLFYVWGSYMKSVFISYILDVVFTFIISGNVETWLYYSTNFIVAMGQTVFLLFVICLITYIVLSKMKVRDYGKF